jgi:hypothetical protein
LATFWRARFGAPVLARTFWRGLFWRGTFWRGARFGARQKMFKFIKDMLKISNKPNLG